MDLRTEFENLLVGPEGLGQLMILRTLNHNQRAPGFDPLRGGSTNDPWDQDEPFAWTEIMCQGYFTQGFSRAGVNIQSGYVLKEAGQFDEDTAAIYLLSEVIPKPGDSIFRVRTSADGSAYYPIERIEKWRVIHALDRREQSRKLAFWICMCKQVKI